MYKFKTVTVKDWKHAVEENTSERTKKMRLKKLALKALKEIAPNYFGPWPTKCEMVETYMPFPAQSFWRVETFAKHGYFDASINSVGITIWDEDRDGKTNFCRFYSYED